MGWTDENENAGVWGDGAVWTLGETGIFLGMPGLYLGLGLTHRNGVYADESESEGSWGDE